MPGSRHSNVTKAAVNSIIEKLQNILKKISNNKKTKQDYLNNNNNKRFISLLTIDDKYHAIFVWDSDKLLFSNEDLILIGKEEVARMEFKTDEVDSTGNSLQQGFFSSTLATLSSKLQILSSVLPSAVGKVLLVGCQGREMVH